MPTPAQRLIYAVRTRNHKRLQKLISEGVDLEARSAAGRTALHAAAEEGDREAARILLQAGAEVNARMENGLTPLHLAASYGGYCDLGDPDPDRHNPCRRHRHGLRNADVERAFLEIIKHKNLSIPSDLGARDKIPEEHKPAVFSAVLDCMTDPKQLYQEFVSRGINLEQLDPDTAEELLGKPRYLFLVELLLEHKADIRALDNYRTTVLSGAVELGQAEMVALLLKYGANPNQLPVEDEPVASVVAGALERSKLEVAELLIKHGARFDPKLPRLLHEAAANARREVVLWLLDRGADINLRDDDGNTPLLSTGGHLEVMKALIKRGADVRSRNKQGNGILHVSAPWLECLKEVLPLGLPINAPNEQGQTPLHLAVSGGDVNAVQALIAAGASVNVRNQDGNTPLHCVFITDESRPDIEFPVFHALVSAGADRSIKNDEGKTAFDCATEFHYPDEYLKLLDPRGVDPGAFIWLGKEPYAGFLPKALVAFELDGSTWPSAEHYFHAQKSRAPKIREQIRQAKTVDAVTSRMHDLGVKSSRSWPSRCDAVMRSALLAKFRQNAGLRRELLATESAILISDSNCDWYWVEKPNAEFNSIGKMLMDIRIQLRCEKEESSEIEEIG